MCTKKRLLTRTKDMYNVAPEHIFESVQTPTALPTFWLSALCNCSECQATNSSLEIVPLWSESRI